MRRMFRDAAVCWFLVALSPGLLVFAPRPEQPAAVIAAPFAPEGAAVRAVIAGGGRLLGAHSDGRIAIALFKRPPLWVRGAVVLRSVGSDCGGENAG